ncbi:MAG: hypothetical protein Q8R72_12020 [Hylemonella sp.]|nr:hypothetical protein [Hylemonella sp.]
MRTIIAIALLCLAGTAMSGEDQRMHLVQPKGPELALTKLVRTNDLFAEFSGQVWVAGTVVGRWPAGATNLNYKEPDYLLVPDQDAAAQLPYFVLREPPYFNQYKVRSIELINGAKALRIAAGEERTRRLLERRVNHVRVSGRFLIEQYVVGVECDAPWAKAILVKAELPEQAAASNAVPEGC